MIRRKIQMEDARKSGVPHFYVQIDGTLFTVFARFNIENIGGRMHPGLVIIEVFDVVTPVGRYLKKSYMKRIADKILISHPDSWEFEDDDVSGTDPDVMVGNSNEY